MSRWRKDPLEICGKKHTNATIGFHECMCQFDYSQLKRSQQELRFKHCLLADEMRRIDNFELYVIIAVVVGVVVIFGTAAICSCKWYLQTNANPCSCCFCSCCQKKKRKNGEFNETVVSSTSHGDELGNGSQAWTQIKLDAVDGNPDGNASDSDDQKHNSFCMKFCMSDPVQDCCEFFDCDIMWRKKSIYSIPIFGRRKPPPMQRRPTRPAPPPPKPTVPPVMKYPEPIHMGYDDDIECEPVPEAPPSPEPVRFEQPRAIYVDPLSFLQRPFLKSTKDKVIEEEPEALYSKVKDFVLGKAKKSSSIASLNKLGISTSPNPDAVSTSSSKKSKYSRTGSLASLHNLSDEQLDKSYHSKRSMSLASLHMVEEETVVHAPKGGMGSKFNVARSRGSLNNICEDDMHPSQRDEYIDLEEMTRRIEARRIAEQNNPGAGQEAVRPVYPPAPTPPVLPSSPPPTSPRPRTSPKPPTSPRPSGIPRPVGAPPVTPPVSSSWTPNFIPASAYASPKISEAAPMYPPTYSPSQYRSPPPSYQQTMSGENSGQQSYYPPVPATADRPAVPARVAVGTPVVNTGTLGRPKPAVPPRPGGSAHSPKPRITGSPKPRAPQPPGTLGRHTHIPKPTAPPPPPPVTTPIESSL